MRVNAMKGAILKDQQGSVVLEALIAILIFSIGILAIIGLQAASVSNTAAARYRTDASLLANQVIGKMWVGDNASLSANFSSPDGADYLAWASSVKQTLPGVALSPLYLPTITFASSVGTGKTVTVTVFWRQASESTAHQYVTTAVINNAIE
jgi:type IV pilus assembly protein PilV